MSKIKFPVIYGIFFGIVFLILLIIRTELFVKDTVPVASIKKTTIERPAESWMNIYQKDKKNRRHPPPIHYPGNRKDADSGKCDDAACHSGSHPGTYLKTETELNPDMSFSSFNLN
jgi:hypothetical protein